MRPWGEDHAARGWDVELPLLPGHAATWQELARTPWQSWYRQVHDAALELSEQHGRIAVGGLSMGGALSLLLAADDSLRGRIGALVLVNPGLSLPPVAALTGLLAPVVPTLPGIASDIAAPGVLEEGYDRLPVRAVGQLRQLFAAARRGLGAVQVPVLLATSRVDHTVPTADSRAVAAGVCGPVERLPLPHSHHVATLDHDAPLLFETSARFLQEHVPRPDGPRR